MLTPFKLALAGAIGDGRQYWSWISLDDAIGAIHHSLMTDSINGPVNAVAPDSITNNEFTKTLGRVLSRPPLYAYGLCRPHRTGRDGRGVIAEQHKVRPRQLTNSGYEYRDGDSRMRFGTCSDIIQMLRDNYESDYGLQTYKIIRCMNCHFLHDHGDLTMVIKRLFPLGIIMLAVPTGAMQANLETHAKAEEKDFSL